MAKPQTAHSDPETARENFLVPLRRKDNVLMLVLAAVVVAGALSVQVFWFSTTPTPQDVQDLTHIFGTSSPPASGQ